jgi:hypothetical protein
MKRKIFGIFVSLVMVSTVFAAFPMNVSAETEEKNKWLTEGNVAGKKDVFGTLNDEDLRFITNGEQRMVLTSEGNLGIGIETPTQKLDVDGNIRARGYFIAGTGTIYGDGFIGLSSGTNLNIDSGTLFIDNANDWVGIGTTSPSGRLEVVGSIVVSGTVDGVDISDAYAEMHAMDDALWAAIDAEEAARIAGDAALQATIDAETAARMAADAALQAAITAEEAARKAADNALQAAIDAEAAARAAADLQLQDNIDAEATARIAADDALQAAINAEIDARIAADAAEAAARQAADQQLQDNIDAEEAARIAADTAEAVAREAADQQLQDNIDTEEAARIAADNALQAALDAETTARIAADDALQAALDAETAARIAADNAEAAARMAADDALQQNINDEEAARIAADNALQAAIDAEEAARIAADNAEAVARQAADQQLQDNIDQEIADRIADVDAEEAARILADDALQAAIDAEIAARIAADADLQATIDQEIADRIADVDAEEAARILADDTLQAAIDAEAAARAAGDAVLQANIDAEAAARIAADAAEAAARAAADSVLQDNIDAETAARIAADAAEAAARATADAVLQDNIDAEAAARIAADAAEAAARAAADATLQGNIDTEEAARIAADDALQAALNDLAAEDALDYDSLADLEAAVANGFKIATISGNVGIGTTSPGAKLDVVVPAGYGVGGAATIGHSSNSATGDFAIAMGSHTTASGGTSTAMGYATTASGDKSTAMGYITTASGPYSTAMGYWSTASGSYSTAMGYHTTASGGWATAMGREIEAKGDYTVAIALSDQNGLQVTQPNTMAIMGGKVGIGIVSPQGMLQVQSNPLTGTGTISSSGTDVTGTNTLFQRELAVGSEITAVGEKRRVTAITSNTDLDVDSAWSTDLSGVSFTYTNPGLFVATDGKVSIGTTSPGAKLDVDVGSEWLGAGEPPTVGGAATIGHNDNSATGDYAIALGYKTTASGWSSTAMGNSVASGRLSTAMGGHTTASGTASTAMGAGTTASGEASTAMGSHTTASGKASTTMGFGTVASGEYSTAMGRSITAQGSLSFGIGLDYKYPRWEITQDNTMAIMGGNVGIGTVSPSTKLHVNGVITATEGNSNQWNTAYGWGDHGAVGYLTTETDPVYSGDPAAGISSGQITNWDTAYGWGDHGAVGYLTSEIDPQVGANTLNYVPKWDGSALVKGTIYDNGKVGIGTTGPNSQLQVGYTNWADASNPQVLIHGVNNEAETVSLEIRDENSNTYMTVGSTGAGDSDKGKVYINGKVGIGTTNPLYDLHIENQGSLYVHRSTSAFMKVRGDTTGAYYASYINLDRAQDARGAGMLITADDDQAWWVGVPYLGGGIIFGRDASQPFLKAKSLMFLKESGNLGIGTTSPSEKLHVIGNIKASGTITSGSSIIIDGTTDKITASSGTIDIDNENLVTIGKVGIGTTSPGARLDVEVDWDEGGAATIGGSSNSATGNYAIAMGSSTTASGHYSTAMGAGTTASEFISTAMGQATTASGTGSTAMGYMTTASGSYSTAMGLAITAEGDFSFGIGLDNTYRTITQNHVMAIMGGKVGIGTVSPDAKLDVDVGSQLTGVGGIATMGHSGNSAIGDYAIAIGYKTTASAYTSTALGSLTTASGHYSTAMGRTITAQGRNSFGIGLDSTSYTITQSNTMAIMGGKVGIGAVDPGDYKLCVETSIGRAILGYSSDSIGVYGRSPDSYAVYGRSDNSYGVYGRSVNGYGAYGRSDNAVGVRGYGDTYDFYASNSGYGPFTGAHEVKLSNGFPENIKPGMIVSVTGETKIRMIDDENMSFSSTLPTVQLSDTPDDNKVFGVIISECPLDEDHWYFNDSEEGDRFGIVNALGEGRVLVTNITGDIMAGDYITTSAIAGYGQKQSDDLLHSYTFGKATENVDWSEVTETVEFDGLTYKAYAISVVYTSG